MEEDIRHKLIEAIDIITESKDLVKFALDPLPLDIGKGELLEKLYFHLTERKLFKSKTDLAQFAIENNLSRFTKSTLVNGGLFRVMFDAFDATVDDLRQAVDKLNIMQSIEGKTSIRKPKPKSKPESTQSKEYQDSWGATIRKHHLPNDE